MCLAFLQQVPALPCLFGLSFNPSRPPFRITSSCQKKYCVTPEALLKQTAISFCSKILLNDVFWQQHIAAFKYQPQNTCISKYVVIHHIQIFCLADITFMELPGIFYAIEISFHTDHLPESLCHTLTHLYTQTCV